MDVPVGEILKDWQSVVTTISRNLMELSEQENVKMVKLKIKDAQNGYKGLTMEKALRAVDGLDTLWNYYALLSGVVDKAADLYSRDSFLKDTEADVRNLLENTPVTLEGERIDINNRKLLEGENNYRRVGLQELLKIMQDSFEVTRSAFNEISSASETMKSRLQIIKGEANALNSTARSISLADIPTFDTDRFAEFESDPLSGLLKLDELFRAVNGYKEKVRSAESDYNETESALNDVSAMLDEMESLNVKIMDAAAESERLFGMSKDTGAVISGEVLDSLKGWLKVLKSKLSEGAINAAKIGAQRLKQECILKLDMERKNYSDINRDYNELLDLKGEFNALLAKYGSLKLKGASFDSSADALIEELQNSLHDKKVDLSRCRELVYRFRLSLKI